MNIVFRVDASWEMGVGHLMRCLTISEELIQKNNTIKFVCRKFDNSGEKILEKFSQNKLFSSCFINSESHFPNPALNDWLGVSWEKDCEQTIKCLGDEVVDWLIVDNYGIDSRWHDAIKSSVGHIMVIDDLANRKLNCDLLMDQTYGRNGSSYSECVPKNSTVLTGSEYALLRKEFSLLKGEAVTKRKSVECVRNILVSMGGMDAANSTLEVLSSLENVCWVENPVIEVVLFGNSPSVPELQKFIQKSCLNIILSLDVDDMANKILHADLAVGAGGTSTWERCCLGLPTIIIATAANQQLISQHTSDAGAAVYVGGFNDKVAVRITESVQVFVDEPLSLRIMSANCFKISDGEGVRRVVKVMEDNF